MPQDDEKYELIEAACAFWFNDKDRIRTPFPKEIHEQLKQNAQKEYLMWMQNLTEKDREEVANDELVGVFEMLLFGEALKLVDKEDTDLLLTIHHPFMPRIGDIVNDEKQGPSRVITRTVEQKDEGLFMVVSLEIIESRESWQTEFMLPK